MEEKNKTWVMVAVAVVVIVVAYLYFKKRRSNYSPSPPPQKENFTSLSAGAIDNVGSLLDDNYDLIQGADGDVPAHHFADLVDQGDHMKEYYDELPREQDDLKPMERLERIQGKTLMPRTSTYVTPFNVDVANPTASQYMVNAPRVSLKSKYQDYSLASMTRGDIPITYNPNVCLVAKTHQGRDDLKLSGLFTPYFNSLYQKYTGKGYKNLVQKVAGAGQASGYGGASSGVIMDNY